MQSSLLHILIPVMAFMLNIVTQVLLYRLIPKTGLLKSIFICFIFVLILLIGTEILFAGSHPLDSNALSIIVSNIIIYFTLGYCYFHFINLGETARRIRILRELYSATDGLSTEEVLSRYNAREIVNKRISRLLHSGQVIEKDGKYYIGQPILLVMAKIIVLLKLLFLGKESEFSD